MKMNWKWFPFRSGANILNIEKMMLKTKKMKSNVVGLERNGGHQGKGSWGLTIPTCKPALTFGRIKGHAHTHYTLPCPSTTAHVGPNLTWDTPTSPSGSDGPTSLSAESIRSSRSLDL